MTHISGHGYWFSNAALARYRQVTGLADITIGQLAALSAPLIADPGMRWEYGISTDWLGQVIEAVSGQDLGTYMAVHVLGPLKMLDTSFAPSDGQRVRLMALHDRTAAQGLAPSQLVPPVAPEFHAGGQGLYATASDYARFMRAILRGGELDGARVLSADSIELASSDQLNGLALPEFIGTQAPSLMNDVTALPLAQSWGLGFQLLLEGAPGLRRPGSGFWQGLFNTYFWIDRDEGLAAAIMTQLLPFFDAAVLETVTAFESVLYASS
jgi:CubicO group peptidase (beta-lactamase class C family)